MLQERPKLRAEVEFLKNEMQHIGDYMRELAVDEEIRMERNFGEIDLLRPAGPSKDERLSAGVNLDFV